MVMNHCGKKPPTSNPLMDPLKLGPPYLCLIGGFKHDFYFQYMGCHPKPIDFHSIIFQDGHIENHQPDAEVWCGSCSRALHLAGGRSRAEVGLGKAGTFLISVTVKGWLK